MSKSWSVILAICAAGLMIGHVCVGKASGASGWPIALFAALVFVSIELLPARPHWGWDLGITFFVTCIVVLGSAQWLNGILGISWERVTPYHFWRVVFTLGWTWIAFAAFKLPAPQLWRVILFDLLLIAQLMTSNSELKWRLIPLIIACLLSVIVLCARWLHNHRLYKWIILVATVSFLTWFSIFAINEWAINAAKEEIAQKVVWHQYVDAEGKTYNVPALNSADLMSGNSPALELKQIEVGCRNPEHLAEPPSTKRNDGKPNPWQENRGQSSDLSTKLFELKIEDPFDKFYYERLSIPLHPINREKNVRALAGQISAKDGTYADLLNSFDDDAKREQLLRHFGNLYGEFLRFFPCRVIRWTNGWVQVTALAGFWLAILIALVQGLSQVTWETRCAQKFFPFDSNRVKLLDTDYVGTCLNEFDKLVDQGNAVIMLREVYEAYRRGNLNELCIRDHESAASALNHVSERRLKKIEVDTAALVYLGWALPSLGFIGTVLGLGTALLTAGDIVTPVSELQRDAIQTVSIYLGRAFDKTFVALLLSLFAMLLIYYVRWAQESVILGFQDKIAREVIGRLRN